MRLIESYILRRVSTLFFTVLLASIGITWTVQMLSRINFLTTSGQSFIAVFQFSSLFIPSAIPLVMPFALVIAIAQTLSTMNQDSELVVIAAAGSPRSVIWRPIILLALGISIISFVIANYVTPYARLNMREMMATANSDLISVFLQEGKFRELDNNILLEIGERRADGSIGRLFIVDLRNPETDLFYYAISGSVASKGHNNFLIMKDGEFFRKDNKTKDVSIVKFDSYVYDLSSFTSAGDTITVFPKDQFLSYLFNPDPDDPNYQRRPLQYTAELHRRFTDWMYPLVFALIALTAAGDARSHREARISASFSAISLSLLVYWIGYFFGDRADNDLAYVPLLYIVPLGSCGILMFMLLTNRRLSLPEKWNDRLHGTIDHWRHRFSPREADNGDIS